MTGQRHVHARCSAELRWSHEVDCGSCCAMRVEQTFTAWSPTYKPRQLLQPCEWDVFKRSTRLPPLQGTWNRQARTAAVESLRSCSTNRSPPARKVVDDRLSGRGSLKLFLLVGTAMSGADGLPSESCASCTSSRGRACRQSVVCESKTTAALRTSAW